MFASETQENKYFRFLTVGRKFYFNDLCVIGDTGWTSFRRGKRRVALSQFMWLPDAIAVKDFKPKNIIAMHDEWVSFANEVLSHEEKVLIVTHFPMVDFTKDYSPAGFMEDFFEGDKNCWWSSTTALKGDNSWRIFGHTHKRYVFQYENNVCSQRGYENYRMYNANDYGTLERKISWTGDDSYDASLALCTIRPYYSAKIIQNPREELEALKEIEQRGFKRTGHADNKKAIAAFLSDREAYFEYIKKGVDSVTLSEYIGYALCEHVSPRTIDAVLASIEVLKHESIRDWRAFFTALVITGYAYNGMLGLVEEMRPVDDYDIMRWYLMFATIQKFNLNPDEIKTVHKNEEECFYFHHVRMYLPKVNKESLRKIDVADVIDALKKRAPLPDTLLLDG